MHVFLFFGLTWVCFVLKTPDHIQLHQNIGKIPFLFFHFYLIKWSLIMY